MEKLREKPGADKNWNWRKKRQNCRCISSFYISLFWKSTRWHILLETEAGWNTMYRQGRQETLLPSHHDSIHGVLSRVHLGESHRPTQGNRTYHSKSWSLVPSVSLLSFQEGRQQLQNSDKNKVTRPVNSLLSTTSSLQGPPNYIQ